MFVHKKRQKKIVRYYQKKELPEDETWVKYDKCPQVHTIYQKDKRKRLLPDKVNIYRAHSAPQNYSISPLRIVNSLVTETCLC